MADLKTLYIPQDCHFAPPGILLGTSNSDYSVVYVVAIVHLPISPASLNSYLAKHRDLYNKLRHEDSEFVPLRPLGSWYPVGSWEGEDEEFRALIPNLFGQDNWISVIACRTKLNDLAYKAIYQEKVESSDDIFSSTNFVEVNVDFTVVVYQQMELWDSEISHDIIMRMNEKLESVKELIEIVQNCKNGILSYESGLNVDENITVTHCCVQRKVSIVFFILSIFIKFCLSGLYHLTASLQGFFQSFPVWIIWLGTLIFECFEYSSFLSHIKQRTVDFCESLKSLFTSDGDQSLRKYDVITSVFIDASFGILLLLTLRAYDLLWLDTTTKSILLPYVEHIALQVEELIKWLMGIPAGLKLNHPLNQFFGHFFLYHVRLWLEYAKIILNIFPNMITFCLLCSCMGVSHFLSIVADAVSTLSFHVYCFYVYAGRFYGLQVSGLMSMWRLFCGKKWNPLRKRVDSLEQSGPRPDQLFAGTLFFTVLLFLLPTTALYYGIFMLLRVMILAIQGILSTTVFVVCNFPYYSMILRLFRPHKFIRTVRVSEINPDHGDTNESNSYHEVDHAFALKMKLEPSSLMQVVKFGFSKNQIHSEKRLSVRVFLTKLIIGDLIRWS